MRRPFRWIEAGDWIAEARAAVADRPLGDAADLVDLFRARYDSIVAYHAGRPADPESYRARGVLVSTPERLFADAREIFPGVEELLPRQDLSLIDGRLGFNLDERFLLEVDTFYMLYGSHFLLGLACQLRRATGVDHLHLLRARGTPTLLECAIPVDHLAAETLQRLCRLPVSDAAEGVTVGALPELTAYDFTIHRALDAAFILRADHPVGLRDHLRGPMPPQLTVKVTG